MGELSIFFPESLVSCHSRIWLSFFFFVFAFKRTYNDRLSVSQERNVSSRGYQRFQGQQLQRPGLEDQGDGLADWFVIKHSRDEALSRDLLSKYGFNVADATKVGISKTRENCCFTVWPAVFKAITVQIQGTRSLPEGVEGSACPQLIFCVCLLFFFSTNLASLWANRARVEKKEKNYFLLSSSFAVQFSLFPYSFFEMKNPSPDFLFNQWVLIRVNFFLKLRSFTL